MFVTIRKPSFEFPRQIHTTVYSHLSYCAANNYAFEKGNGYCNCIYDFGANTMIGSIDFDSRCACRCTLCFTIYFIAHILLRHNLICRVVDPVKNYIRYIYMNKRVVFVNGVKTSRTWSSKYKKSIDCKRPKGFSQRQYCKYGRKTRKNKTNRNQF